jgi:hypothetical protein
VPKQHTNPGRRGERGENWRDSRGSPPSIRTRGTGTTFATGHVFVCSWGLHVVRIRRPVGDALISVGALAMLLAVLVSVDDRVRQQVSLGLTPGTAQAELRGAGAQAHDLAAVLIDAARHQSIEHAPMMIFVFAASVLFVCMFRT